MENSNSLAILILAAGQSTRLKEPKQLVQFEGKSLLLHACSKALQLSANVYVVLSTQNQYLEDSLENLKIKVLINDTIGGGISSSIQTGISHLKNYNKTLIMLCDQPLIPSKHFQDLLQCSYDFNDSIVCSFYNNDVAVPSIFPKTFYKEMFKLQGDIGAKKIIKQNNYIAIELEDTLSLDIDTQEEKYYLQSLEKESLKDLKG